MPPEFHDVRYAGARHPGSARGLAGGANCQLYAYAVLAHHGLTVPPVRSSELWADTVHTVRVSTPRPLDLLLFNADDRAFGAHVGVWAGPDQVLHLCAEVGRPAVWSLAEFAARPRYRVLVGIKRARNAG
ncbi:hydrolase [Amycolatopsis suaedae]|uniref:Hydrolase n=1 Tax=Amycolatopsis suaedae TaxID=2510978 RepID=A0A4V2EKX7_9PSEU|nr:hydrolase [Amycolatopsis suaedae]